MNNPQPKFWGFHTKVWNCYFFFKFFLKFSRIYWACIIYLDNYIPYEADTTVAIYRAKSFMSVRESLLFNNTTQMRSREARHDRFYIDTLALSPAPVVPGFVSPNTETVLCFTWFTIIVVLPEPPKMKKIEGKTRKTNLTTLLSETYVDYLTWAYTLLSVYIWLFRTNWFETH